MADFELNSGATAPAQDTKPASIQPFISTPPERPTGSLAKKCMTLIK